MHTHCIRSKSFLVYVELEIDTEDQLCKHRQKNPRPDGSVHRMTELTTAMGVS